MSKEHAQVFLLDKEREHIEERRHAEIVNVTMRAAIVGAVIAVIGGLLGVAVGAWVTSPATTSAVTAGE